MITSPPSAAAWLRASRCHQPGATLGPTGMNNLLALGTRMDTSIRGHGGKACDPRATASSRPGSRTGSHGHSAVASTRAHSQDLRWSEHYKLAQTGEVFTFGAGLGKRDLAGGLPTGLAGAAHTIWSLAFRLFGPAGRVRVRAAWLAVPAGVGFGDGEAECLELGDELAQAAVVVEPGAVVGELIIRQDPGGGPAVLLAGPLVVGAVQPGRVGVAAAVRPAAAGHPVGEGAGQGKAQGG